MAVSGGPAAVFEAVMFRIIALTLNVASPQTSFGVRLSRIHEEK